MMLRITLVVLVTLAARVGSAQVTDELVGVRTLGMGGVQRAIGTNNDAIYANPAGIALSKRYDLELQYVRSRLDSLNAFNGSIVDSKTGPVAGGVAYTYTAGGPRSAGLHRIYTAFGAALGDALSVGVTAKHFFGHYTPEGSDKVKPSLWAADVGALAQISDALHIGLSARNVVRDEHSPLTRRDIGAGLAYASEAITLSGDAVWDLEDKTRSTAWRIGGEYVAGGSVPLRAGFARRPYTTADNTNDSERVITAGAGVAFGSGSITLGYEMSIDRHSVWKLGAGVALNF